MLDGMVAKAQRIVGAYTPPTPSAEESVWRVEALEALARAERDDAAAGLLRRGPGLHLTASAMVVDAAGRHALLLHHPKVGRWLQPGGHADGDGDLLAVARREVAEETALEDLVVDPEPVDLAKLTTACGVPGFHLDVRFLLRLPGPPAEPRPVPVSPEGLRLAWFPLAELAAQGRADAVGRLALAASARLAAGAAAR